MSVLPVLPARVRAPAAAGMRRERLAAPLRLSGCGVGLVVAPAGAGKTTLLAGLAQDAGQSVAWLTLDERIGGLVPFLDHLRAAVLAALPGRGSPGDPWSTVEQAIADLERLPAGSLLVVLDDLHTIQGQPAEAAVQVLLDYLPPSTRLLLAARWRPGLDLHRLRLSGQIRELGPEELRFRAWEIEELFRDCHGVRLRPDEVTTLARSTSGWAAGLQLFHLATRGRPASDRGKILTALGGTRLVRDYLTTQVLDSVAPADRDFLIRTCVFDRLTEARCDELLGAAGSGARLAGLEKRGLFTFTDDDGSGYRYHEVLRVHLRERLVAEHGDAHARAAFRAAARLCERDGALTEALVGYSRAGDWDQVRRLLSVGGRHLADDPADWFALLPASIRETDPWVLLAMARGLAANGSLDAAARAYRDAVAAFGAQPPDWVVREQAALDDWLAPAPRRVPAWTHALRLALTDPAQLVEGPADTPPELFVRAVAALVAGEVALAAHRFATITSGIGATPAVESMAAVGRAVCALLATANPPPRAEGSGQPASESLLDAAVATAEALGFPAVLRVAAAVRSLRLPAGGRHLLHLIDTAAASGDQWGVSLMVLCAALAALAMPDGVISAPTELPAAVPQARVPAESARARGTHEQADAATRTESAYELITLSLDQAATTFDLLAAPALATWARAARLLAARRAGTPPAPAEADRVVRAAARLGPAPHALALVGAAGTRASPATEGTQRTHPYAVARRIGADAGAGPWVDSLVGAVSLAPAPPRETALPAAAVPAAAGPPLEAVPAAGRLTVRCLGRFEVVLGGAPVDLAAVAPRNLELLHVLAVSAGQPLHRDRLVALVWPDSDPARSYHSLQVAVSALRKLLAGQPRRAGQGYQLVLASPDDLDVRRFERLAGAAAVARRAGDTQLERESLTAAIAAYAGDLVPSCGAEWLVAERERLRGAVTSACERAAALARDAGDAPEAIRAAERGLGIDRFRDGLWRLLIAAYRQAGQPAAAARAQERYQAMLADLGVVPHDR